MRKFNSKRVSQVTHDLANPRDTLTNWTLSVTFLPFVHTIFALITYKIMRLSDRKL